MDINSWTLRFKDEKTDREFDQFILTNNSIYYRKFLNTGITMTVILLGFHIVTLVQTDAVESFS